MSGINLTMRSDYVCKDCPDRKRIVTENEIYDCHNHCERFLKSKSYNEEVRQKRAKKNTVDALLYGGKSKCR